MKLNIIVALSCEAAPLIRAFKLKKVEASYPLYEGVFTQECDHPVSLLVSGIGKLNAAAGVGWLAGRQSAAGALQSAVWLNVGTAGHAEQSVGSIGRVARCLDSQHPKIFYPPLTASWRGDLHSVLSGNSVVNEYPVADAVDMEASAFFDMACRFASAELVQSLKVISDNAGFPVEEINSQHLASMIEGQLSAIQEFCKQLLLCARNQAFSQGQAMQQDYCAHLRCTQSQKQLLSEQLQKLLTLGFKSENLQMQCRASANAKELIHLFDDLLLKTPPTLSMLA